MPWLTIVGVSGNLKHTQLMNEMTWVETPILYRPLAQEPRPAMQIAVRAQRDLRFAGQQIQNQISAVDSVIPINDVEILTTRLAKTLAYPRFRAMVLVFFAVGALLLSAIGLHGVLSQLVTQRMAEFGVRRAVGAQWHHLLLLILRQGGTPVITGLAAGVCLAVAFGRVMSKLLYGIHTANPGALALAAFVLLGVAVELCHRTACRSRIPRGSTSRLAGGMSTVQVQNGFSLWALFCRLRVETKVFPGQPFGQKYDYGRCAAWMKCSTT